MHESKKETNSRRRFTCFEVFNPRVPLIADTARMEQKLSSLATTKKISATYCMPILMQMLVKKQII